MKITLLCNAGLMIEYNGQTLLIDAPNDICPPFFTLPDLTWSELLTTKKITGLYFTHTHPDHYDQAKVTQFRKTNPDIPVFLPNENENSGNITIGEFEMEYHAVPHAPILQPPPHVATLVKTARGTIYLPADSDLNPSYHNEFLNGRKADIGIWNAMFLSRQQTRELMRETACRNYIYHMPLPEEDTVGIWKKCKSNYERYGEELRDVTVLEKYPSYITI